MRQAIGIFAVSAGAIALAGGASAQNARDVRGASPYEVIENEPAPKLVVDPPFPKPLERGVFQAQYRVENLRIVPVFNAAAIKVTPRIGHLHIIVDDLPWWWADSSDNNTVDIANLPPGPHKVTIRLVNPNHEPFPGQETVLRFTVPERKGPVTKYSAVPSPAAEGVGDGSQWPSPAPDP